MGHYVRLEPVFHQDTGGNSEIHDVGGRSIRAIIENIDRMFPGFRAQVLASSGRLFAGIYVDVNGRSWEDVEGPLPASATVAFKFRSIAGG